MFICSCAVICTQEPEHAEQDKIQALLGPDIEGKPQILADQKETIGSSDYRFVDSMHAEMIHVTVWQSIVEICIVMS